MKGWYHMKKTVSLLLLFCFLLSLTAVGAMADGPYTDGVYTGTAQGFGGEVSVTLTVENGEIKEAAVVGDGETGNNGLRIILKTEAVGLAHEKMSVIECVIMEELVHVRVCSACKWMA